MRSQRNMIVASVTPTWMGLRHSTSLVLSTHVILLGMPAKLHILSYLKNACTGASQCMLADGSGTRGHYYYTIVQC